MKIRSPSFAGFKPASETSSHTMSRNRSKNTRAELLLRKHLWEMGLRYRVHAKGFPGKPDLAFLRRKIAVFCDGDFWHGRHWEKRRQKLEHGSNAAYWVKKIEANIKRDKAHTKALKKSGWQVIRLWETDILQDPDGQAEKVYRLVMQNDAATR